MIINSAKCFNWVIAYSFGISATAICEDDLSYRNPIGLPCVNHKNTNCEKMSHVGYSLEQVEGLIESCPKSCGKCRASREHDPAAEECNDNPTYRDMFGMPCIRYIETNCEYTRWIGFADVQVDELMTNCPVSCGQCPKENFMTYAPSNSPSQSPSLFFTEDTKVNARNSFLRDCEDDPTYSDSFGLVCSDYLYVHCQMLISASYSQQQVHELQTRCLKSCGTCDKSPSSSPTTSKPSILVYKAFDFEASKIDALDFYPSPIEGTSYKSVPSTIPTSMPFLGDKTNPNIADVSPTILTRDMNNAPTTSESDDMYLATTRFFDAHFIDFNPFRFEKGFRLNIMTVSIAGSSLLILIILMSLWIRKKVTSRKKRKLQRDTSSDVSRSSSSSFEFEEERGEDQTEKLEGKDANHKNKDLIHKNKELSTKNKDLSPKNVDISPKEKGRGPWMKEGVRFDYDSNDMVKPNNFSYDIDVEDEDLIEAVVSEDCAWEPMSTTDDIRAAASKYNRIPGGMVQPMGRRPILPVESSEEDLREKLSPLKIPRDTGRNSPAEDESFVVSPYRSPHVRDDYRGSRSPVRGLVNKSSKLSAKTVIKEGAVPAWDVLGL